MKLLPILSQIVVEGLNLIKKTPEQFAENLIRDLIVTEKNPDSHNENYISYYDINNQLVMDFCKNGNRSGSVSISSEKIFNPIQKMANTHGYDDTAPIIRKALQKIFPYDIDYIHNISQIEKVWYR